MEKDQLTFNDLPTVVGELCDRIASMENLLTEKLSKQYETKEDTHVPMTVQEACNYLKMPLSTFYYKVKKDDIPVIKQGKHLYIYRDELDRWLESSRKNPAPQSFEDEMSPFSPPIAVNRTLKTGSDGKDGHYYSFSGRIGRLHGGVYNKRNEYIRTLPGGSDGGRYCYRNIGKLQCLHRESQKQENFQRFSHCRIGIERQHRSSLSVYISRK